MALVTPVVYTNPSYRLPHDTLHWPPPLPREEASDTGTRVELEKKAKQVSDEIDRALAVEKSKRKKQKNSVRILLLGQAESGKSTTLKNFQLHFAPRAFHGDAESWRTVIHLNLVHSVNFILDLLNASPAPPNTPANICSLNTYSKRNRSQERPKAGEHTRSGSSMGFGYRTPSHTTSMGGIPGSGTQTPSQQYLSPELRRLKLSLLPLKSIEDVLNRRLATIPRPQALIPMPMPPMERKAAVQTVQTRPTTPAPPTRTVRRLSLPTPPSAAFVSSTASSSDIAIPPPPPSPPASKYQSKNGSSMRSRSHPRQRTSVSSTSSSSSESSTFSSSGSHGPAPSTGASSAATTSSSPVPVRAPVHHKSFSNLVELAVRVRSNSNWKRLARISSGLGSGSKSGKHKAPDPSDPEYDPQLDSVHEVREFLGARAVIEACGEDIIALWKNKDVQDVLRRMGVILETQPGFFLNDVARVTAPDFVPNAQDILRARVSTIGVEEHKIKMETGPEAGEEWVIYDVGGSRSQRAVWAPFFDSVSANIFLAPISAFDEKLAEDPFVNRLQDTIHLWRAICSNRLLANIEIILFLNKCDVLKAKLRAGVRFAQYCTTYDDEDGKRNDPTSVARYILASFHSVHRQFSPRPRKLHAYLTSVIDSRATSKVLAHVRELVMVGHLTDSNIL